MAGLAPGAIIAERYQLERKLGEGGMGSVWAAMHTITKKPVALKFLKAAEDATVRRRFLREARAASAVRHKNVIAIHDVVELDEVTVFMVMDLLEGETLAALLDREGRLPLPVVANLLLPVVSAVGAAHAAGIVHRDLKPENIFLEGGADSIQVKVLDFGIAKLTATAGEAADTGALTGTGSMLGTPYYMAPEQVFGEKDLDQRVDVWAMGVILFECLAGRRPTEGDGVGQIFKKITVGPLPSLTEAAPEIPESVARVVDRLLARDRDERPKDLSELLAMLRRHTSLEVQSFPALAQLIASKSMPPSRDAALAEADTVSAGDALRSPAETPAAAVASASDTAAAVAASSVEPANKRSTARLVGVAALITVVGVAWFAMTRPPERETAGTAGGEVGEPAAQPPPTAAPPPAAAAPAPNPRPATPPSATAPSPAASPGDGKPGAKSRKTPPLETKGKPATAPSASAPPPVPTSSAPKKPGASVIDESPW